MSDLKRAENTLLDPERLNAGAEYTTAIMSLGLDPDLACWVYFTKESRPELVIVSSMVDRAGPQQIYELLFKAYDASATPKELDPFSVGLYSPNSALGMDLLRAINIDEQGFVEYYPGMPSGRHLFRAMYSIGFVDGKRIVVGRGVYRVRTVRRNADQDRAKLLTFRNRVEALAA